MTSGAGMVKLSRDRPFFLNRGRPTRAPARVPEAEAIQFSVAFAAFWRPETRTRRGTVCIQGSAYRSSVHASAGSAPAAIAAAASRWRRISGVRWAVEYDW